MNHVIETLSELSIDVFAQAAWAGVDHGMRGLVVGSYSHHEEPPTPLSTDRHSLEPLLSCGPWSQASFIFDPGPDPLPPPGQLS